MKIITITIIVIILAMIIVMGQPPAGPCQGGSGQSLCGDLPPTRVKSSCCCYFDAEVRTIVFRDLRGHHGGLAMGDALQRVQNIAVVSNHKYYK